MGLPLKEKKAPNLFDTATSGDSMFKRIFSIQIVLSETYAAINLKHLGPIPPRIFILYAFLSAKNIPRIYL